MFPSALTGLTFVLTHCRNRHAQRNLPKDLTTRAFSQNFKCQLRTQIRLILILRKSFYEWISQSQTIMVGKLSLDRMDICILDWEMAAEPVIDII